MQVLSYKLIICFPKNASFLFIPVYLLQMYVLLFLYLHWKRRFILWVFSRLSFLLNWTYYIGSLITYNSCCTLMLLFFNSQLLCYWAPVLAFVLYVWSPLNSGYVICYCLDQVLHQNGGASSDNIIYWEHSAHFKWSNSSWS